MNRRATTAALILVLLPIGACNLDRCVLPGCEQCDDEVAACPTPCEPCASPCDASEAGTDTRSSYDLTEVLRTGDRVERERAVDALARMGPGVLPEMEPLLGDPDAAVRFTALQVLVRLRGEAWPAVWYLKNRLCDPDAAIRADAAYVIGMTGTRGAEAVPELAHALQDTSPYVRYRAAVALQRMDRAGEPALAALRRASRCDRDPRVREAADCAIERIEKATCRAPE